MSQSRETLQHCCVAHMQRSRSGSFSLRYRIAPAAAPEVRSGGGGRLATFDFAPVETTDGAFRIGVQHLPSAAVALLEVPYSATDQNRTYQKLRGYIDCIDTGVGCSTYVHEIDNVAICFNCSSELYFVAVPELLMKLILLAGRRRAAAADQDHLGLRRQQQRRGRPPAAAVDAVRVAARRRWTGGGWHRHGARFQPAHSCRFAASLAPQASLCTCMSQSLLSGGV